MSNNQKYYLRKITSVANNGFCSIKEIDGRTAKSFLKHGIIDLCFSIKTYSPLYVVTPKGRELRKTIMRYL